MATDVEVKCIKKTNRNDPDEIIHGIGGVNADGTRWYLTLDTAIADIETGKWRFWTAGGGKSVWIITATDKGHKYLKTEADGRHPNNLLSLPECL